MVLSGHAWNNILAKTFSQGLDMTSTPDTASVPVSDWAPLAPAPATPAPPPMETPAASTAAAPAGGMALTIAFNAKDAALLEYVARLRMGAMDEHVPIDLGEYVRRVLNQDLDTCVKEIQARRGA